MFPQVVAFSAADRLAVMDVQTLAPPADLVAVSGPLQRGFLEGGGNSLATTGRSLAPRFGRIRLDDRGVAAGRVRGL